MLVGYARTSTADQKAGLEAQVAELKAAGVEELFVEQVSSVQKRGSWRRLSNSFERATLWSSRNWIAWHGRFQTLSGLSGLWRKNRPPFASSP